MAPRPRGLAACYPARRAMSLKPALAAIVLAAAPGLARAGETACWFERGVVVVTAQVAGVTGDFILDTGAPQTILAETQAQGAGYEATAITGEVELAGVRTAALPIAVKDIDVRTGLFAPRSPGSSAPMR
jgi:predicted aspartyl protease